MKNNQINILVKKILKNKWKIITIDELKKILQNLEQTNIYKKIYYLKNRWYLISLKKDLFFVKEPDQNIDEEEIIEKFYWKILHKYLKNNYWNNYFIWWVKALEFWNNNFSIPEKITIINPFKRSTETILKWKKVFNTLYKIKYFEPEKSFKYFKKQTEKITIDNKNFIIANYELSLLESLYSPSFLEQKYIEELVKKNIRKNSKKINLDVFEYFLKIWKYWEPCKRLYEIASKIKPDFAEKLKKLLLKWYWL